LLAARGYGLLSVQLERFAICDTEKLTETWKDGITSKIAKSEVSRVAEHSSCSRLQILDQN